MAVCPGRADLGATFPRGLCLDAGEVIEGVEGVVMLAHPVQ